MTLNLPTITGQIGYLAELDLYQREKPFFSNVPFFHIPGTKQQNIFRTQHDNVPVYDLRGNEGLVSLDTHGFEIRRRPTTPHESKFLDEDWIQKEYWPDMEQFIKQELGAREVKIFDHTVRRANPNAPANYRGKVGEREPSKMAHVDQTSAAGEQRVRLHMKDRAEQLLKGRHQIMNVWHPLFGPVKHAPLILCDYNSVDFAKDLRATDLIYPHYIGEQWYAHYNPNHRWYYVSDQMPQECWFFKSHDSVTDGRARFVMHTSLKNAGMLQERPRESIEFRCLVFYEE